MKRIGALVLLFMSAVFVFAFIASVNVSAEGLEGIQNDPLVGGIANLTDKANTFNSQQDKGEYLNQEWNTFIHNKFQNNTAGRILLYLDDALTFLSPAFKSIIGVPYSLSWAFLFAVLIWLALFFFIVNPAGVLFNTRAGGIIGTFAIVSLIGLSGVIKKAVDMISLVVSSNTIVIFISVFLSVLMVVMLNKAGIGIGEKIKKSREKAKKEKLEKDRKVIGTQAEVAKKELDSYKDVGEGI